MQHRQNLATTVGAALCALGGPTLVGFGVADLTVPAQHLDAHGWFWLVIVASAALLAGGLYLLFGALLGLPLPNPRSGWPWANRNLRASHPIAMASAYEYGRPELAEHLAEIKEVARRLLQGGLRRELSFGPNPEREKHMLTCHFPKTADPLRRWSDLHQKWSNADDAVREQARSVEAAMDRTVTSLWSALHDAAWVRATGGGPDHPWIQPSVRAESGRVFVASLRNQQPAVVAYYADEAEKDALLQSIQEAVNGVAGWRQTRDWEKAHLEAARARDGLAEALRDIQRSHVLHGRCDYC